MKSVLISIQPKWCELIASGKKTIEVRKTRPKIETPFKCYIYCTKDKNLSFWTGKKYSYADERSHNLFDKCGNGEVIGEFVCDKVYHITPHFDKPDFCNQYLCDWKWGCGTAYLSFTEISAYLKGRRGYGWHISDLVIYDEPKSLEVFNASCLKIKPCEACRCSVNDDLPFAEISVGYDRTIRRPPQSWCYVEEL